MYNYWHTMTNDELNKLLETNITRGEVKKNYKQPEWCKYPEALHPFLGCWSLTLPEYISDICESYCEDCDMFDPCWRLKELLEK
jgi:hypothetical protein